MDVICPNCGLDTLVIKRGKTPTGKQQFYCKKCQKWFGGTSGTIFYYKHFTKDDIIKICHYIVKGKSIRVIADLTHKHRNTICQIFDFMASNAYEINEIIPFTDYEKKLLWHRMKKRKKTWSDSALKGLIEIRKGTSRYIRKEDRYKWWFY